MIIDNDEMEN